jgi:hypothetical protein
MDGSVAATGILETTMILKTITATPAITIRSFTVRRREVTSAQATRVALAAVGTWAVALVADMEEVSAVVVTAAEAAADIAERSAYTVICMSRETVQL